jgi:hypothetical protein
VAFNAIEKLRETGIVTTRTSPEAVTVLSTLNESEVDFLDSLNARIKSALAPAVVAHSEEGDEDSPCLVGMSCGSFGHHKFE